MPWHLEEQKQELAAHLKKYSDKYGLDEFAGEESYVDPSNIQHNFTEQHK
jgi:hypothetical protein